MGTARLKAFRVGSGRHAVFQGEGPRLHGGRWNSAGRAVVYCGASFAIALLERLVYAAIGSVPENDRWVMAEIPDRLVELLDEATLPGWDAPGSSVARSYGDRWLAEGRSVALVVPSAVTRIDRNVVINPSYPEFGAVVVGEERPVPWDRRLFARSAASTHRVG
jgi:RES domain-containing protein